jgi:DNA-binding protein H-NS
MARKLSTLKSKLESIQAEIAKLERSNSKGIAAVHRVMSRYGVTLEDLMESKPPKRHALAGVPAPVKYRDPKTGDTWSGRGRPAIWLVQAEKAGRKRDSFLVKTKLTKAE